MVFFSNNQLIFSQLQSAIIDAPLIVSSNTIVTEAIAQMSGLHYYCNANKNMEENLNLLYIEARSSCVLVRENEQLVGILTERDITNLSAKQIPLEKLLISEVMTSSVITLKESDFTDLFSIVNIIQKNNIRHLPILGEDNNIVGLITHETLAQVFSPLELLRLRSVSEVMTREVVTATVDFSILEIAKLMTTHHVSSVVIVKSLSNANEVLLIPMGIITERDLLQFQALGLNMQKCLVETVMSQPIFAVFPDDSLSLVQQIMKQKLINRLVVTGNQGELLGIITRTSLLKALNPLEIYKIAEILQQKVIRLEVEKSEILEKRTIELEGELISQKSSLKSKAEREKLVMKIATQILSSLSLQKILDTTVKEVQQVLRCNRVNIWRFDNNFKMLAVAECTQSSFSLLNRKVEGNFFEQTLGQKFCQGNIQVVHDISTIEISDSHRDLLISLQIRAEIIIPIFCDNKLWGLLNASESEHPRKWQEEEIELLKNLSVQLAIAIRQATIHQELQQELKRRKAIEEQLRKSEERYATLVTSLPVGIFHTDAMGKCNYVNERWCQIAGLSLEKALGDGWLEGLYPEDKDKIGQEWYQSAEENRLFQLEYRFQDSDGNITWVYGQSVAEKDQNGNILGYVGSITDINYQKKIEQELEQLNENLEERIIERTNQLQESQIKLEELLKELSNFKFALDQAGIVVITDAKGVITYVNDLFCQISGYSEEELIGKTHRVINSGYHPPSFFQDLWKTIASGEIWYGEICNRAKDHSLYWVTTSIVPFLDSQGKPFQYLLYKTDIKRHIATF